ncbi:MAG TPA: DUF1501 domain-containing protein [Gemmataceae bacterium]|nr:DUF1501 domain-containing protein [Gemmataceae bacterium]
MTGSTRFRSPNRRDFLWRAGGGFGSVALTALLAEDGFFASPVRATTASEGPLAPRPSHHPAKAKAVICLFMYGGVSHLETFDPKPELNRRSGQSLPNLDRDPLFKVRHPGKLLGSLCKFRKHGESGIEVSDFYPHLARHVDDLCILRGMRADSFAHGSGLLQMNTGYLRLGYPSLGSWISYGLGTLNQNLPAFVVMLDPRGGPIAGPSNWNQGFMPAAHQGTQLRVQGDPILNLSPPSGVSADQQRNQLDLLGELNRRHQQATPDNSELAARIASYELAFRMQRHAPEAVDLGKETESIRRLYGLDNPRTAPFGRRCLLARRLIERGVRFVQLYSGGGHAEQTWDAHGDVLKNHTLHCGETDQPIAALLTDLKQRGLLDSTLVVWTSEFGRTPTGQNGKGRDHSPRGFASWLAGGGVQGGQTIGATDEFGYAAVENKVHVHDLHATILHLLGMDHEQLTFFHGGREHRLTDVSGRVVQEVLG